MSPMCPVQTVTHVSGRSKLLHKLDKFRMLQLTAQLQCKPIKKRGIT